MSIQWRALQQFLLNEICKEVVVLHDTNTDAFDKIEPFLLSDCFQQIKSKILPETREALQAMERELRARGLGVKIVTRSGQPAQEILKLEEKEDVSGVAMGSHDWSGLQGLFAGSVAEAVVHNSKRPVLVVKH